MQRFEYKVVPAPRRGQKGKGVKGTEARFAYALQTVMNEHAADGWEYLRTDTLPAEERSGIASKQTVYQNMLVFRRLIDDQIAPAPLEDETANTSPETETAEAAENTDVPETS